MRIDAHQHYWSITRGDYGWITPDLPKLYRDFMPNDLLPHLAHHQIEGTILVQAAPTLEESLYILQLADKNPSILGVVGWIDIFSDEHEQQYLQLKQFKKFVGLRIMVQEMVDSTQLLNIDMIARIAYYVKQDIPIDLLVVSHQLDTIVKLLELFPKMNAVIDHIGKPNIANGEMDQWSKQMCKIAQYEHVYCKISGMVTEADHINWDKSQFKIYIEQILAWFGMERVMFGSDWPVCLLAASYDEVVDIVETALPNNLSQREIQQLFGLNAKRFYKLKGE